MAHDHPKCLMEINSIPGFKICDVIPTHDNSSFAYIVAKPFNLLIPSEDQPKEFKLIFNGEIQKEWRATCEEEILLNAPLIFLSPNGKSIAIVEGYNYPEDWPSKKIYINGKLLFKTNDRISDFCWHPHGDNKYDFCWSVNDGNYHYFLNGRDVTNDIEFSTINYNYAQFKMKDGVIFRVYEDGRTEYVEKYKDRFANFDLQEFRAKRDRDRYREEHPEEFPHLIKNGDKMSMKFQNKVHRDFDSLSLNYCINANNKKIAYTAYNRAKWDDKLWPKINSLLKWSFSYDKSSYLMGWLKIFVGWPLAFLTNPYFGIYYALSKACEIHFIVDNGDVWTKNYRQSAIKFYTPSDNLVVWVKTNDREMIVINQEEGIIFDKIVNIRWLEKERCLCYLGIIDNHIYRASLHC